jgi:SAM-dependent methyltransferase
MSSERRERHAVMEPGNLLMLQERERLLARILRRYGYRRLDGVRVFEAGCGGGYNLRLLIQWGADPELLAGMDVDANALEYAQRHSPPMRLHHGSADRVPEPDQSFDLSLAFTLFSSVRNEETAEGIASELFRVTRPGGLILIYDMRRNNPRNPAVHAVEFDDIRRWFPKCPARRYTLTLAPPIARPLGRIAPWLYGPLAAIPVLRTHALYVLRRPATSPFADTP